MDIRRHGLTSRPTGLGLHTLLPIFVVLTLILSMTRTASAADPASYTLDTYLS